MRQNWRRTRTKAIVFKINSFHARFDLDLNEHFIDSNEEREKKINMIKSEFEKLQKAEKDDVEKITLNDTNKETIADDNEKNIVDKSKEQKRNSTDNSSEESKNESFEIIDENHHQNNNRDNSNDAFLFTGDDQFFSEDCDDYQTNWLSMFGDYSYNFL